MQYQCNIQEETARSSGGYDLSETVAQAFVSTEVMAVGKMM